MQLLHDIMEGRDYGQLKDLISDRSRWRQDSKWECMSETCWKQQKTKEEGWLLKARDQLRPWVVLNIGLP